MTEQQAEWNRRSALRFLGAVPLAAGGVLAAAPAANALGSTSELEARIAEIINRPEFQGARWGMKIHVPETGETITAMQTGELFPIGSTVKMFLSATALAELGPGYRFRTRVYGTGPVVGRELKGDLVVVAGGDILMGGRVQPDGSLAVPSPDHANNLPDAAPLPGDPLRSVRDIACRVAARGITRVNGRVVIDTSLFRAGEEKIALGDLTVPVTPIMINDNVLDVVVRPGRRVGAPAKLTVTPDIGYVRIRNEITTAAPGSPVRPFTFADDVANPDGTHVVRLTGEIAIDRPRSFCCYYLRGPVRFAELAFTRALRDAGVRTEANPKDVAAARRHLLTEHVSPPVSEAVRIMSNIHSAYWPYLFGAIAGRDPENAKAVGTAMKRKLQEEAGLDPTHTAEINFSPEYFVDFLTYLTRQSYFRPFHELLSVMGRSGSLANVQVGSPAVGSVFAKAGHVAGTSVGVALAGYIEPRDGQRVVFAQYMEKPQLPTDDYNKLWDLGTESQGEIATAVWQHLTGNGR